MSSNPNIPTPIGHEAPIEPWYNLTNFQVVSPSGLPVSLLEAIKQNQIEIVKPNPAEATQLAKIIKPNNIGSSLTLTDSPYQLAPTPLMKLPKASIRLCKNKNSTEFETAKLSDRALDETATKTLEIEISTQASMDHPHIAQPIDLLILESSEINQLRNSDQPSIRNLSQAAMIFKETLVVDYWESKNIPVVQKLDVLKNIAEAVDYAHSKTTPVVLNNINPESVMVVNVGNGNHEGMLYDFSECEAVTRYPAVPTAYKSPNRCDENDFIWQIPSDDVWSTAVFAYKTVCGKLPFDPPQAELPETIDEDPIRAAAIANNMRESEIKQAIKSRQMNQIAPSDLPPDLSGKCDALNQFFAETFSDTNANSYRNLAATQVMDRISEILSMD